MPELFEMRIQWKVLEAAQEQIIVWEEPQEETILAADLVALVAACTQYPRAMKDLMGTVLDSIRGQVVVEGEFVVNREAERSTERLSGERPSGSPPSCDSLGRALDQLFARSIKTATRALNLAKGFVQETGHEVEGLKALAEAISALTEHRARVLAGWPWSDRPYPKLDPERREKLKERSEARKRGEHPPGKNLRDVVARLASGGPLRKD